MPERIGVTRLVTAAGGLAVILAMVAVLVISGRMAGREAAERAQARQTLAAIEGRANDEARRAMRERDRLWCSCRGAQGDLMLPRDGPPENQEGGR